MSDSIIYGTNSSIVKIESMLRLDALPSYSHTHTHTPSEMERITEEQSYAEISPFVGNNTSRTNREPPILDVAAQSQFEPSPRK